MGVPQQMHVATTKESPKAGRWDLGTVAVNRRPPLDEQHVAIKGAHVFMCEWSAVLKAVLKPVATKPPS